MDLKGKNQTTVAVKELKPRTETKQTSLFSNKSKQSISAQLQDTISVVRYISKTGRNTSTPIKFWNRYVLDSIYKHDLFVVAFGLPALSDTPRVLDAAPSVHSDLSSWTYNGERTAASRKNVLNVASYNYLGFVDLEYNTKRTLEYALENLPVSGDTNNSNLAMENALKAKLKTFTGFDGCVLTGTGYAINLVAFPAMASAAVAKGSSKLVVLMDTYAHSSMFMGAHIAKTDIDVEILKFRHNDAEDLEVKLQKVWDASVSEKPCIWVAVEGIYSMSGSVPPLDQIYKLKKRYNFNLYVDEAHSFLALGKTGRGVSEYFQNFCDVDDGFGTAVDMMATSLAKSLSSIGGIVLCRSFLTQHVEARLSKMLHSNDNRISTLALIRSLQILGKPGLVCHRLAKLSWTSNYITACLRAKGYKVSTTPTGPLISIIFDTIDKVLRFLKLGRKLGLICCGAAYPAAPRDAPLVRLSINAAYDLSDIKAILDTIDTISRKIHVNGLNFQARCPELVFPEIVSKTVENIESEQQSDDLDTEIIALCSTSHAIHSGTESIRAASRAALSRYGLGAAGPRWMYGSFSSHLSLEQRLDQSVNDIISTYVGKEHVATKSTLFTNYRLAVMSIIGLAMEGLTASRAKRGERSLFLLPKTHGIEVDEGIAAARPEKSVKLLPYSELVEDTRKRNLSTLIRKECASSPGKIHLTLYLDLEHAQTESKVSSWLTSQLADLTSNSTGPLSITLLIHDPYVFSSNFSSLRATMSVLNKIVPDILTASPAKNHSTSEYRFLYFNSFNSLYEKTLGGLHGAFCTGSEHLVQKLQFLGASVMYTAMMPPVNAVMIEEALETLG